MTTKTLYSWDSRSVLRMLNKIAERLAVLDAAGIAVPLWEVEHARETLLSALLADVSADAIEPVAMAAE